MSLTDEQWEKLTPLARDVYELRDSLKDERESEGEGYKDWNSWQLTLMRLEADLLIAEEKFQRAVIIEGFRGTVDSLATKPHPLAIPKMIDT